MSQSRRYLPFALGMGLFTWLIFGAPAPTAQISRAQSGNNVYLPFVARDYNTRLARVNYYRSLGQLPGLTENAEWSDGAFKHARYMVKTDQGTNYEDTGSPWFTTEGNVAAANSLLFGAQDITITDEQAVDYWMRSPFQALSILDAELRSTGIGSYREADGGVVMAMVLDVARGQVNGPPAGVTFPVKWPGNGQTINLRTLFTTVVDYPDPLAHPGCAGNAGLPIIVQFGDGSNSISFPADPTTLSSGGSPLAHCAFNESNYTGADSAQTSLGRLLLSTRDAVVLIPKLPLTQGATYTVTVRVNGMPTATWSFTVAANANP
ncbi:MAG: CAP domain-containing protein [Anaerolineales bacterium]